ncbi:CBS domain-containing protein [Pseudonocardia hydrocarbonoxydans]|uniref:CBS domain-containing protein n=1 Tax=Pseudonocardia hydrocarbonoxydans TaxID=76726 RepID=UPI0031CEF9FB
MPLRPERLAAPPDCQDDDPMVSTLMTTRVVAITPDAPVSTALNLMASAGVRHLPVLDGTRCRGVLREPDVIRHLLASPISPVDRAATPVARLTRPAASLPASARRSDAARCMDADTDAVLVTDRHGLVGIVTATDLIRSLAREAPRRPEWIRP